MKSIKFEDYLPFEKLLIVIALISAIISLTLLGLTFINSKIDGYNTMIMIGIILSVGVISLITALGNVLLRLYKG